MRVFWFRDPRMTGTVVGDHDGEVFVAWDASPDDPRSVPASELRPLMGSAQRDNNPPMVYAPDVQDLEFTTRLDSRTNSTVMERDEGYRGHSGPQLDSAEDIYELFQHMGELDREHIVVALLNVRGEVEGWKVIHVGVIDSVEASVRQIVKDALFSNAHSMVLLHNHPSGDPIPSDADRELTQAVVKLADGWDIAVFDHVVVGRPGRRELPYYSFREHGLVSDEEPKD